MGGYARRIANANAVLAKLDSVKLATFSGCRRMGKEEDNDDHDDKAARFRFGRMDFTGKNVVSMVGQMLDAYIPVKVSIELGRKLADRVSHAEAARALLAAASDPCCTGLEDAHSKAMCTLCSSLDVKEAYSVDIDDFFFVEKMVTVIVSELAKSGAPPSEVAAQSSDVAMSVCQGAEIGDMPFSPRFSEEQGSGDRSPGERPLRNTTTRRTAISGCKHFGHTGLLSSTCGCRDSGRNKDRKREKMKKTQQCQRDSGDAQQKKEEEEERLRVATLEIKALGTFLATYWRQACESQRRGRLWRRTRMRFLLVKLLEQVALDSWICEFAECGPTARIQICLSKEDYRLRLLAVAENYDRYVGGDQHVGEDAQPVTRDPSDAPNHPGVVSDRGESGSLTYLHRHFSSLYKYDESSFLERCAATSYPGSGIAVDHEFQESPAGAGCFLRGYKKWTIHTRARPLKIAPESVAALSAIASVTEHWSNTTRCQLSASSGHHRCPRSVTTSVGNRSTPAAATTPNHLDDDEYHATTTVMQQASALATAAATLNERQVEIELTSIALRTSRIFLHSREDEGGGGKYQPHYNPFTETDWYGNYLNRSDYLNGYSWGLGGDNITLMGADYSLSSSASSSSSSSSQFTGSSGTSRRLYAGERRSPPPPPLLHVGLPLLYVGLERGSLENVRSDLSSLLPLDLAHLVLSYTPWSLATLDPKNIDENPHCFIETTSPASGKDTPRLAVVAAALDSMAFSGIAMGTPPLWQQETHLPRPSTMCVVQIHHAVEENTRIEKRCLAHLSVFACVVLVFVVCLFIFISK